MGGGGEENAARPVTRDGEEGELRIRDQDVTPQLAGLEALQQATPAWTENPPSPPPPLMCILQYNLNCSDTICMVPLEGMWKVSADIQCL